MPRALRLLIVEDSEDDALLVLRELRRGGFEPTHERVDNPEGLKAALGNHAWQAIICDYSMPRFNGLEALRIVQKSGLDIPFIVVSGTIGEDVAVEAMRSGAHDYVMKDSLARLGPAVERELREAQERLARRRAEQAYRSLVDSSIQGFVILQNGRLVFVNPAVARLLGSGVDELMAMSPAEVEETVHPADRKLVWSRCRSQLAGREVPERCEFRLLRDDGRAVWVEVSSTVTEFAGKPALQAAIMDITERMRREREQRAIATVATSLRKADNRTGLVALLLDQVTSLLGAEAAALAVRDPETNDTVFEQARGAWESSLRGRIPAGEGLTGRVLSTGLPFRSNDARHDPDVAFPETVKKTRALAGVPLLAGSDPLGVLWIGRKTDISEDDTLLLTAIAEMTASAIRRITLHEQTRQTMERLKALHTIDLAIATSQDLSQVFGVVLDQAISQLGIDGASVLRAHPHLPQLEVSYSRGIEALPVPATVVPFDEGVAGTTLRERRIVAIHDLGSRNELNTRELFLAAQGFTFYCAAPLIAKGEVRGVLEVCHRENLNPSPEWLSYLETLAGQTAIAIDNAELLDDLRRSNLELRQAYDSTLEGWARALELRDADTEGHTRRVTELAMNLASRLGLNHNELVHMRRGALLHDIGKMAIPDSILRKPGPLDPVEWEIMKKHPVYAHDMLSPIAYLRPVLDVPYCHHERWDGSGYPRGLVGEEIPLSARIFAVADVWDAVRADRPYREAWSEERAISYLREGSGRLFDPRVVAEFLVLIGAPTDKPSEPQQKAKA